ncbi:Component of the BRCA1-A complex, variant 2 [Chamberlinius hualienensis]
MTSEENVSDISSEMNELTTVDEIEEDDDSCFEVEHNPILSEEQESSHQVTKSKAYVDESMESKRYSVSDSINLDVNIRPKLPSMDCPEKIIICLDTSKEMEDVPFRLGNGAEFSPLYMAKRVLEIFVICKHRLNPNHEFGLMVFNETGKWICDFTKNVKEFTKSLDSVMKLSTSYKADLSSCFDLIEADVAMPKVIDIELTPPPFIVRTIFVYGRSRCIPTFETEKESFRRLSLSNYFFVDVLYMHVVPGEDNNCE